MKEKIKEFNFFKLFLRFCTIMTASSILMIGYGFYKPNLGLILVSTVLFTVFYPIALNAAVGKGVKKVFQEKSIFELASMAGDGSAFGAMTEGLMEDEEEEVEETVDIEGMLDQIIEEEEEEEEENKDGDIVER